MLEHSLLIAFKGGRQIALGTLPEIEDKVRQAAQGDAASILVLDAETSVTVDIPLQTFEPRPGNRSLARGPGRPRLGVTSREVSLLPRHWDWLAEQPGGASATLRRLIEQARRSAGGRDRQRRRLEAVDRFMRVMAGDLPNYEEASRAFYQQRREDLQALIADWPADVLTHLQRLLARFFEITDER